MLPVTDRILIKVTESATELPYTTPFQLIIYTLQLPLQNWVHVHELR